MVVKYYLDTSIWIDLYDARKGMRNEPFGEYAWKLISFIRTSGYKLIISDWIIRELSHKYSLMQIKSIIMVFEKFVERVIVSSSQVAEAKMISEIRGLPIGDAVHAILARDNDYILVTRDKHFTQLRDISSSFKPESLI